MRYIYAFEKLIDNHWIFFQDNNQYISSVFNETVSIVELDEGLDSETFFLFIVLGALVVLAFVGLYQLFQTYGVCIPIRFQPVTRSINSFILYFYIEKAYSFAVILEFEAKI